MDYKDGHPQNALYFNIGNLYILINLILGILKLDEEDQYLVPRAQTPSQ